MIPDYMDRKHDYSFARDRQLQNKLLAADDIFDQPKQTTTSTSAGTLRPSNLKDKFLEVTGWYPDDRVVLRKPEHDNYLSKPRTSVGTREGVLTRDRSKRDLSDSSFAFHHYHESHRYIEQYRRDHTCTDSTNSANTRNEFLELQRFYAYRSQTGSLYTHPTAVGYVPQSQSQTYNPTRREHPNIHYRTSDSNLRSASRYKLSPSLIVRSEPAEPSKEFDQTDSPLQVGANAGSTSKMAIHAVSKTPIPKVPAKVTVPANHSMISPGLNKSLRTRKTGSPKAPVAWENSVGAVRTLDTLACVAAPGDKVEENTHSRSSPLPELTRTPRMPEERPEPQPTTPHLRSDSENSDAVSFDRLSTTCLGADIALKARPRLEASCTYHVFPGEEMLVDTPTLFTSSMLWNPAKSTLDRRSSQVVQFDPGLNNPFKNNVVNHVPVKVPDKEQMVKEFINDLKPLNLSVSSADVPKTEITQRGLRGSSTKPDLPSNFELQGVSRSGRPVTQQEPRARKGKGKLRHRDGDRKSQSAHSISTETDTSASSKNHRLKPQERESFEGSQADGTSVQQPSMPYFKFWNSSLPQRLKAETEPKRDTPQNGEMNLRKIAELMLNNEELPEGELEELIQRRANKSPANANGSPSIASGSSGDLTQRINQTPVKMAEAAREEEEEEPTRKDPCDARSVQISDRETRQLPITHTEGKMLLPSNKGELSPSKSTHCQLETSQEIPQLLYKGETSQPFNTQIHSEMLKSSNTHKQERISSLSDTLKVSGNFQFPSMHIQRDFCQSLKTHSEESTSHFPNTHSKRERTQSPVTHDQDGTSHPPNTQSQGDSSLALNIDTWTDSRKKESVTQSNSATAVDVPRTLSFCSTKASDMVTHTHTPPKPRMSRKLSADNPRIVSARTTRSTNSSKATSVSSRKDQKEKAPCRSVISNNAMDQLSMISVRIRSAEDKKTLLGSSRKLTLLERRGHITLAPTRHGLTMGKDHTASWCPDDALEKSTEDSVSSADIMDSSGESLNSSLEVAFSSQEEIDVSEESISQVTLYSSQEPVSSGQEEMNTCQKCHIVNNEHLHNSRDNFCNRQENTDVSKEDTGCNPASLSVRQGGDDRLAALHSNRAGIPVCHEDTTRNICDMMETPTDVFIKQEALNTNHELIPQCQADVCDGEGSDSLTDESSCSKHVTAKKLPPTTNCTFSMSTAQNTMMPGNQNLLNNSSSSQRNASSDGESRSSLQATDAGHGCQESRQQDGDKTRQNREFSASGLVEKRPAQNPNSIQLSNETENNTRWEMMVLLHAEQHRQKSVNRIQSSTPSPRLIQQTASQFQQRTSSPYQNVPIRRVGTKNQGVSTQAYKQATSHLKRVAKNRALGMFTSPRPDGETNTAYELNLCQRGGSSSSATFNKRDRAGSQTSQKNKPSRASFIPREPLTRSSSSPVHPKTYSIQTQGSPRKGVPNQHPQGSLVLVYQDMDTMMVVGNECRHRPHTSPSHVTSTLRCSPRRQLNQQTRLLPNPRQGGVRVIMHPHPASPTPPLTRTPTEDMRAEGVVAVMETPRYNSSGPNHDNVGGQDQTMSVPLQSCLLGVGGKKCTFSPRPDSVG